MKILIRLSSLLLSTALAELVNRDRDNFQVIAVTDANELSGFTPEKIIVDPRTLNNEILLEWPEAKVILLDLGLGEEEIVDLLYTFHIDGVISTDTDSELFKKALDVIGTGQTWIDNGTVRAVLNRIDTRAIRSVRSTLSKKEQDIIIHISQGLKNKEIAEKLFISEQTVKAHLSRIFRKCNVKNRAQLVPLALRLRAPISN